LPGRHNPSPTARRLFHPQVTKGRMARYTEEGRPYVGNMQRHRCVKFCRPPKRLGARP